MSRPASPYHLAGPFAAAAALFAAAAAKLRGQPLRPEYQASLVASLMSAGLSAASAYKVNQIGEGVAATNQSGQRQSTVLEEVFKQSRRILENELTADQVRAFDLGASVTFAGGVAEARWDSNEQKRAMVVKYLAAAQEHADALQVKSAKLETALRFARDQSNLFPVVGSELQDLVSELLNSLLRR